ncbi:2021_t:CDS:2, partial [Entrophospora sp. SA101]
MPKENLASWYELETKTRDVFGIPQPLQFGLTYEDREGDIITFSSEAEYKDALLSLESKVNKNIENDKNDDIITMKFGLVILPIFTDKMSNNDITISGEDFEELKDNSKLGYLYEDIVSYHMTSSIPRYPNLPSRCNLQIDSSLLTSRQLRIIINWIRNIRNELNINSTPFGNKYTFTLLYKASHDGFQNNIFNDQCASQGSCLVVTKCDETNKIIGGYTSVGFNYSYGYYNDSQ